MKGPGVISQSYLPWRVIVSMLNHAYPQILEEDLSGSLQSPGLTLLADILSGDLQV